MFTYFQDTIQKHIEDARNFYMVKHSSTMVDVDKALQYKLDDLLNDDTYTTIKKEEDEILSIILFCYMNSGICQFEKEYIYKYSKVLNNNDRKKLLTYLLEILNKVVMKYRDNYPLLTNERKEQMFDIINILGLLMMSIGLISQAAKEANDNDTHSLLDNDTYKNVQSLFVFEDRGFRYKLKEI